MSLMTDSSWSVDTSTAMFASDPLKPSPQRINLKFISSDHEDFVLKSTFQLTSKKSKKISG